MPIPTIFHAKYATRNFGKFRGFANVDRLVRLYNRTGIDIYPHQIVAALAAMEDPLRPGFILADEVGLGKGVEAMLVVSQYYLDGKKVLIVAPTPLTPDWHERISQFGLNEPENEIESESGETNSGYVLVTSYKEAVENEEALKEQGFDLVVFEEAHRLRKFHEGESKTANTLHETFKGVQKLLLTATPILKNVMDLYGLIEFIDPGVLGNAKQFYVDYYKRPENYYNLSQLIHPYIFRTLRSQVKADVNLPERNILTYQYELSPKEKQLEQKLTKYLAKSKKVAFPDMDAYELSLLLGKSLASSVDALIKTLSGVYVRLGKIQTGEAKKEFVEIKSMLNLARQITNQSKGAVFVKALETAFKGFHGRQIKKKAIVFTESVETQKYITQLLQKTKYTVAVYNGSTGGEPLNKFRGKDAQILVTTDNASEGFDFSFCNLVINYDNPWSVSTLEQRIGRVHRIGQKNDVVAIDFLCTELISDVRFYELAFKRLNMIGGILGNTDDVVSTVSAGDIEARIKETLAATRNAAQTNADFVDLTASLEKELEERKESANELLFRSFDEELAKKTKNYVQIIKERGENLRTLLWELAQFKFKNKVRFEIVNGRKFYPDHQKLFRAHSWNRRVYEIDWTRETLRGDRFTIGNRLVNKMFLDINEEKYDGGHITLQDETLRGLRGTLAHISISLTDDKWKSVYKTMLVGHDSSGNQIDEKILERVMELPCTDHRTSLNRIEWYKDIPEPEGITAVREAQMPTIVDELKHDFNDVIINGRKRITVEFDRARTALYADIDKADRELTALKRQKERREGDPFALDQKIATLSKELTRLREAEFMTKLKLKKDEESRLAEFMSQFTFKTKTSVNFVVDFTIV